MWWKIRLYTILKRKERILIALITIQVRTNVVWHRWSCRLMIMRVLVSKQHLNPYKKNIYKDITKVAACNLPTLALICRTLVSSGLWHLDKTREKEWAHKVARRGHCLRRHQAVRRGQRLIDVAILSILLSLTDHPVGTLIWITARDSRLICLFNSRKSLRIRANSPVMIPETSSMITSKQIISSPIITTTRNILV